MTSLTLKQRGIIMIGLDQRGAYATALGLAVPASLAAMVTPLLGLVDTSVLSRTGVEADLAGVAMAGAVFSLLYWSLGFLRMSVAGLTAQADGANSETRARAHLAQGILMGLAVGAVLALTRGPIAEASVTLFGRGTAASAEALAAMHTYIEIRLTAAPLAIATLAILGWLTGQGRTGLMMLTVVAITGLNAALDIYYVLVEDRGAAGIALGTAIAEASGFGIAGLAALWRLRGRGGVRIAWSRAAITDGLDRVLALNGNIFLRTFLLAVVFAAFVRAGAGFGDLTVAANQVLMQIVLVVGLFLDGPAIAAETMVGKALGQSTRTARARGFALAVRVNASLTAAAALVLTHLLFVAATPVLSLIVPAEGDAAALFDESRRYFIWAAIAPLFMAAPFFLDGVYIGATRGAALRNSMVAAALLFAVAAVFLPRVLGNHGLWLAFGLFMGARAAGLFAAWRGFTPLIPHGTGR